MGLIELGSDSHTIDGCDRVVLAGDRVIVQGAPVTDYGESASIRVPEGETLNAISVRVFLEAARELERLIAGS